VVEARSAAPMMPLALFRSRTFSGVNLMTLLLYMPLGAAFFFIPFDLIRIQGYTAAAFLPFPLIMTVLSRWSGGLLDRFGARLPLVVGALITAAGLRCSPGRVSACPIGSTSSRLWWCSAWVPSSTAARVACSASSTRSFFSLTSTSVAPPP
jgi:hypothetical protein